MMHVKGRDSLNICICRVQGPNTPLPFKRASTEPGAEYFLAIMPLTHVLPAVIDSWGDNDTSLDAMGE